MSFKLPCPSCEAPVLIKNPKLVGTKVECPKCKYRFKVEEPAAAPADPKAKSKDGKDATKDAEKKPAATDAKKKTKAAAGKNKKLVPILVGVGAVVLLAVVGFAVLGGKKPSSNIFGSGGGGGGGGGGGEEPPPDGSAPPVVPKDTIASSTKKTENLLPGDTVAVYRFNVDKLRESPLYSALADPQMAQMFETSMGFPIGDVETYIHCFAGKDRQPFGVMKLTTRRKAADITSKMQLQPKPKAVKGRDLHAVRSAPFLSAVSASLSMHALVGDLYETLPMAPATPTTSATAAKPFGVCVYDTQHVLVGDYAMLERFLGELDANGDPPFKTQLASAAAPAAGGADKSFTSIDAYRSLEFPLKKALDDLEADRNNVPLVVYAEKFDATQYDPKLLKKEYKVLSETLDPIAARTRLLSANITTFTQRQLVANVRIDTGSGEEAKALAKDQLGPGLTIVAELLKLLLTTPVEFRDYTLPGGPMFPNPLFPGGPMGEPGMRPGDPGSPDGGPPGPGMGPRFRPGGQPMPGGPGPIEPPGPGMMPVDPNDPNQPQTRAHIDLAIIDNQILVSFDLTWPDSAYRQAIAPRLVGVTNQIKGKMAVFSSEFSWHAIAAAGPKANAARNAFPRGTFDRPKSDPNRLGLEYPPVQRVSLFADLLPYMGRGQLASTIDKKYAWYAFERERPDDRTPDKPGRVIVDNLSAAGQWVPELLVPYYPQSAWRATSPYAPDHVLGATNYVAVAGSGLDAARYDPNNPELKKKVGITGYGWGSKAEEVTDGLANTIYLLQTPPGLQQPWLAGGGATVRGLDERDPMAGFKYDKHPGGKPGTYALMGDGSVRFIPADIDPKVLLGMSTRAGGEDLADLNLVAPRVDPPKAAKVEPKPPVTPPKPDDKKPEEKKPEEKKTETPMPGEKK